MTPVDGKDPTMRPDRGPINVVDRFDAESVWVGLGATEQFAVGVAALNLLAAQHCEVFAQRDGSMFLSPLERASEQAARQAARDLHIAFLQAMTPEQVHSASGQPRLPEALGLVCQCCGCSQDDACGAGCGWASTVLCTACAGPAAERP